MWGGFIEVGIFAYKAKAISFINKHTKENKEEIIIKSDRRVVTSGNTYIIFTPNLKLFREYALDKAYVDDASKKHFTQKKIGYLVRNSEEKTPIEIIDM